MSHRSSQDELSTRSTTNTQTFLESCVLNADHKALEEHLISNPVQQSDLDRCLMLGLQTVQQKGREFSHVAPTLTLLLQSGAKWDNDALLDDQKTPLHIICESRGDHHELLDLVIKSSQQTVFDAQDALMCAVENANINCVKWLIANRADLNIECERSPVSANEIKHLTPIMRVISMLSCDPKDSLVIMSDVLDVLLNAAVDQDKDHFMNNTEYILCACKYWNVNCIKKLINIGAPLDAVSSGGFHVWQMIAGKGDVELLKCMFNSGFDKDTTDQDDACVLVYVVNSRNIEAVRYLLDLGVTIPCLSPNVSETQCKQCKESIMIIDAHFAGAIPDPCLMAIYLNRVDIVKLLDEYGSPSCKLFTTLRYAVELGHVDVVSYLLNKYTHLSNREYIMESTVFTLLSENRSNAQIRKVLLDHGADPAKPNCLATDVNAIMAAIEYGNLYAIAQYIRSGVDINFKSRDSTYGNILPFVASVLHDRHNISVMLLVSGCSRGMFSNDKFKTNPKPKLEKLMKEWNVYDNDVTSLQLRCRSVILNHLSPRADMKVEKLPLPPCLIKFLSIPDLDKILSDRYLYL